MDRRWLVELRADGTGDMALPGPAPDVFEGWTNWSPDGRLFVQRWTNGPQAAMIGLVPADGHDSGRDVGPRLATGEDAFHAAWAPDGTRILAFSDSSRMLLSIDTSTYEVTTPAWTITETPDGQRVAP